MAELGLGAAQSDIDTLYVKASIRAATWIYAESVAWSRWVTERGKALAQFDLGNSYYNGESVLQGMVIELTS